MSIEDHQTLLDIEDHAEWLANVELAHADDAWIVTDIVKDILWLVEKVRHHDHETSQYREEIEILMERLP